VSTWESGWEYLRRRSRAGGDGGGNRHRPRPAEAVHSPLPPLRIRRLSPDAHRDLNGVQVRPRKHPAWRRGRRPETGLDDQVGDRPAGHGHRGESPAHPSSYSGAHAGEERGRAGRHRDRHDHAGRDRETRIGDVQPGRDQGTPGGPRQTRMRVAYVHDTHNVTSYITFVRIK
jgi:hypothetical protein